MIDAHVDIPTVSLCYCVNQAHVNAMLVSLWSALEHGRRLTNVSVLYSGSDLPALRRRLDEICRTMPYEVFDVRGEHREFAQQDLEHTTVGASALLKLLVPNYVKAERALFLDADTIVRSDLAEVCDIDLEGKPLAAAQDWHVPTVHAPLSPVTEHVPADCDSPYFNSGVMLMDVDRMRRQRLAEEAAKLDHIKGKYADQDLFNVIMLDNWASLDRRWNYPIDRNLVAPELCTMHEALWETRKLSHYMGRKKPWIFPFNLLAMSSDFTDCRARSSLRRWVPTPWSRESRRYYAGFLRRKIGMDAS